MLGVPIVEHKGDTIGGQLRLLAEKLGHLKWLLQEWGDRKVCCRWDLESLIRILNYAAKVVQSSRTFLRHMLDLLHGVLNHPLSPHPICLNMEFRSDLAWW